MPKQQKDGRIRLSRKDRKFDLKPTKTLSVSEVVEAILASRPSGTFGAEKAKWMYLEEEILSKYLGPELPQVPADLREAKSIVKMLHSEYTCRKLNDEGMHLSDSILQSARKYIKDVLKTPDLGKMFENSSFTGGASTSRTRANGDPYYKFSNSDPIDVTPDAYNMFYACITATPQWCVNGSWDNIKRVASNRICTVPKTTLIDRPIAAEPDGNCYLQKAVGNFIRRRLRTEKGIDLNDQSINQRLAQIGSEFGSLATIDLSSASDSISQRLVFELLDDDWVELLDKLRSPYGSWGRTLFKWEKHSSMGNAYTFELESLIFAAIAYATADVIGTQLEPQVDFHVYGDDIIVPSHVSYYLIHALEQCGFSVNTKKSFTTGPFRESCGKHYYYGSDITPFYIRKPIDSLPRIIWLLNRIRSWSATGSRIENVCDPSLWPIWVKVRRALVPPELLGGYSTESITSVASPHAARSRIEFKSRTRKCVGWRGYLRTLMYASCSVTISNDMDIRSRVLWGSLGRSVYNGMTVINPQYMRFRCNTEQYGDVPYFPQEM